MKSLSALLVSVFSLLMDGYSSLDGYNASMMDSLLWLDSLYKIVSLFTRSSIVSAIL